MSKIQTIIILRQEAINTNICDDDNNDNNDNNNNNNHNHLPSFSFYVI